MPASKPLPTALAPALLTAALALGAASAGQQTHMHDDQALASDAGIGEVDFRVSCDEAVRARFDHALGLMHHMMYEQARSEFEQVAAADPGCAMAYWGVATTLFQPLWGTRPSGEDLERGRQNVRKAKDAGPGSERERLLLQATEGFFGEPEGATVRARIERWAEGMEVAYQANPADADTGALYALSRLVLAQWAADRGPLHDQAEAILRGVWQRSPTHPGAVHYSIHATDADGRASNALEMVQSYAGIAPEVPHALHMPSHIYVRLGDWSSVIEWNRRSAEAALRHPVGDSVSHHYIHAIDYLVYAHLQRGEDARAEALRDQAMQRDAHQASFVSAYHLAALPARMAVERQRWDEAAALQPRTPGYLPWDQARWPEGLTWFARGLGGLHTDDLEQAREATQRMQALRDQAREEGDENFANYIEVDLRILTGALAQREGRSEEALRLMRSAAELEATLEKHPVTPGALLPPNEALGNLLLDLDRPGEALSAYRTSDRIWPGRYHTLLGGARAARQAGDEAASRDFLARLLEVAGDSEREAVRESRRQSGDSAVK
jgi:tetratricopeptide (TPR) repeat protein